MKDESSAALAWLFEGLASIHSFSHCWHEQRYSRGFGCELLVKSCETIHLIQRDARSREQGMHVTSVWTQLYTFSSQWPVKCTEVQKINPSNEAHILHVEPGPTRLAAFAVAWRAGHMDSIISPWSAGISESTGQQLPLLQPLLYGHRVFLTQLHNINKCVYTGSKAKESSRHWVLTGNE